MVEEEKMFDIWVAGLEASFEIVANNPVPDAVEAPKSPPVVLLVTYPNNPDPVEGTPNKLAPAGFGGRLPKRDYEAAGAGAGF